MIPDLSEEKVQRISDLLDEIRALICVTQTEPEVSVIASEMGEPPVVEEPEKITVAKRLAFAAWDLLKGEADPAAADLPPETKLRLELFAKEIRNKTIEQLAGAIDRYLGKMKDSALESLLALKE